MKQALLSGLVGFLVAASVALNTKISVPDAGQVGGQIHQGETK